MPRAVQPGWRPARSMHNLHDTCSSDPPSKYHAESAPCKSRCFLLISWLLHPRCKLAPFRTSWDFMAHQSRISAMNSNFHKLQERKRFVCTYINSMRANTALVGAREAFIRK
jgi:hypothetical protein